MMTFSVFKVRIYNVREFSYVSSDEGMGLVWLGNLKIDTHILTRSTFRAHLLQEGVALRRGLRVFQPPQPPLPAGGKVRPSFPPTRGCLWRETSVCSAFGTQGLRQKTRTFSPCCLNQFFSLLILETSEDTKQK